MTVKIVTDSSADLPAKIAEELGVTVVPLYVRFGNEVYRDRVDITEDQFFQRLQRDPVHPATIQPSPQDFAKVYETLCQDADGIVSIHISSKLSGTCNAAEQGREMVGKKCPIEVIDSQVLTGALAIVVASAARMAKSGAVMPQIVAEVKKMLPDIHLLGLLDTLKYVALGGRIGRAKALLGSVLNVKPILTLKDGEVAPAGQARSRSKGIERLYEYVHAAAKIEELAIAYSTPTDQDALALAERLAPVFPKEKVLLARIGPMLGVHIGPGALIVSFRGKLPA